MASSDLAAARCQLSRASSSLKLLRSTSQFNSRTVSPEAQPLPSSRQPVLFETVPRPESVRSKGQVVSDFLWLNRARSMGVRPFSRDVSYRRDPPSRQSLNDGQQLLAETLGIAPPKTEAFPLPTDLAKLEELFVQREAVNMKRVSAFDPTPNQVQGSEAPLSDFHMQKFLDQVETVKKQASEYHISKDKAATKEGGLLFKTKSGLIKEPYRAKERRTVASPDWERPVHMGQGKPSGKQEIDLLGSWLDYMTYFYVDKGVYESVYQKTRAAQLIYTMCFRELIRQVSVHCAARGLLMDRIWNSSVEIFTKSEFAFVKELEELKHKFREVVAKAEKHYDDRLAVVTKKYAQLNAELRRETKRAEDKEHECDDLKTSLARERKRLKDMNDAIETLANASVAARVEEERKRLQEEYVKLRNKPQILRRTVQTSTTEDEYLLQESLEVSSVPELRLKKAAPKRVVLQGFYDLRSRFHKTHELRTNAKGDFEVAEFADALVTEFPGLHKETNTEEDLGWQFFDQAGMNKLRRRLLDISEEEIGKGLWVSDYAELLKERKHRDASLVFAMQSLWAVKHPILSGVRHRGTQLFGHEVKEELEGGDSPNSSASSVEFKPLGQRRDSIDVQNHVRSLEELLGKAGRRTSLVGTVGRLGMELIKTAEVAEETVTVPTAVIDAMGKMMVSTVFAKPESIEAKSPTPVSEDSSKEGLSYISEESSSPRESATPEPKPLLKDACIQTDSLPVADSTAQTEIPEPPSPVVVVEEPEPAVAPKRAVQTPSPTLKVALRRTHPSTKLLLELAQTDSSELRATMHIKTLMKTINSFYADRIAAVRESVSLKRVPLVESLYELLLARHGLKSVAEKKLREVLSTAVVFADKLQRVSLFVNFSGLRDRYSTEDWNCYLSLSDALSRW